MIFFAPARSELLTSADGPAGTHEDAVFNVNGNVETDFIENQVIPFVQVLGLVNSSNLATRLACSICRTHTARHRAPNRPSQAFTQDPRRTVRLGAGRTQKYNSSLLR